MSTQKITAGTLISFGDNMNAMVIDVTSRDCDGVVQARVLWLSDPRHNGLNPEWYALGSISLLFVDGASVIAPGT